MPVMAYSYPYPVTDYQREILDWVRGFADAHIAPVSAQHDRDETTPTEVIAAAAEAGLYSFDFITSCLSDPDGLLMSMVAEELSAVDAGITLALLGTMLPVASIIANGTPEQIQTWIPLCFGTPESPEVAAFVASEPDAGSDVSAIRCRAVYDETTGEYVLTGTKTWGTNAGIADVHVITATLDPELGSRGQAAFLVRRGTPGFTQGQKFSKMGIRASHTAEVVLDGVRIPADQVLGGHDKLQARLERARTGQSSRSQAAMRTFEATRPLVAAMAVGIARASYEYALNYACVREAFGKPIINHQGVAFDLADMRCQVDAARLLTHRAAQMAARGGDFAGAEGSQAKLMAGRAAVEVSDKAITLLGGAGYIKDHPVEKWLRDAKIFDIFEGAVHIQKLVIARTISGQPIR